MKIYDITSMLVGQNTVSGILTLKLSPEREEEIKFTNIYNVSRINYMIYFLENGSIYICDIDKNDTPTNVSINYNNKKPSLFLNKKPPIVDITDFSKVEDNKLYLTNGRYKNIVDYVNFKKEDVIYLMDDGSVYIYNKCSEIIKRYNELYEMYYKKCNKLTIYMYKYNSNSCIIEIGNREHIDVSISKTPIKRKNILNLINGHVTIMEFIPKGHTYSHRHIPPKKEPLELGTTYVIDGQTYNTIKNQDNTRLSTYIDNELYTVVLENENRLTMIPDKYL